MKPKNSDQKQQVSSSRPEPSRNSETSANASNSAETSDSTTNSSEETVPDDILGGEGSFSGEEIVPPPQGQTPRRNQEERNQPQQIDRRPTERRDPVQRPANEPRQNEVRNRAPAAKQRRKRKQVNPKPRKNRMLQQVKYLQRTVHLLIAKRPFQQLIREVIMERSQGADYRIQSLALEALQESAEMYIAQLFEDAFQCTVHAKRVTLFPTDVKLAKFLRGPNDPGNQ